MSRSKLFGWGGLAWIGQVEMARFCCGLLKLQRFAKSASCDFVRVDETRMRQGNKQPFRVAWTIAGSWPPRGPIPVDNVSGRELSTATFETHSRQPCIKPSRTLCLQDLRCYTDLAGPRKHQVVASGTAACTERE